MLHCGAAAWALVSIEMSAHQLKMACELWSILMGCRGFWPGSICSRPLYQDINTIPHAMHHQSGISHTVVGRLQARVVVPWKRSSSYLFIYTVISKCSLVATRTWRQQVNNTTPTSLVLPTSRGRGYVIVVVAVAYVRGHLIKFGRNGDLKREKRWSYEDEFFSTHYDAITHTSFELDLTGFFFSVSYQSDKSCPEEAAWSLRVSKWVKGVRGMSCWAPRRIVLKTCSRCVHRPSWAWLNSVPLGATGIARKIACARSATSWTWFKSSRELSWRIKLS